MVTGGERESKNEVDDDVVDTQNLQNEIVKLPQQLR